MRRLYLTLISVSILLGVTGCSFKVTRPMLKMMMSGSVRTTVASLPCSLGKATMWCCWSTESTTESRTYPMNWPTAHFQELNLNKDLQESKEVNTRMLEFMNKGLH